MICLGTPPGQDCRRQAHIVAQRLGPVIAPSYGIGSCQDGRPSIQCGLHAVQQNGICGEFFSLPAVSLQSFVTLQCLQRELLLDIFCSSC